MTNAPGDRDNGRCTITLPDGGATDDAWPAAIDDAAEVRNILWAEAGARGAGQTRKGAQIKIEW